MMLDRTRAVLLLVAASVLWSVGGFMIKLVEWNPMAIAGTRSAVAAVFLLLVAGRPRFRWSAVQIGTGVAHACSIVAYVVATRLTTAANAVLLSYTAPVYAALLGMWILHERLRPFDWMSVALILGGLWLFFVDDMTLFSAGSSTRVWGNLIAGGSGVSFALVAVLLRKQRDTSPITPVMLGCIFSAVACVPFMFQSAPSLRSCLYLLILGSAQVGLPWLLYTKAIRHVTAVDSILILMLEPVLNPILTFLVVGEVPGAWSIAGGALVITVLSSRGIYLARGRGRGLPSRGKH